MVDSDDNQAVKKGFSSLTKCWNCNHQIPNTDWCENCGMPINQEIKEKILSRETSKDSIKCFRCGGTTSSDICGVCGSPLSRKGIDILKRAIQDEIIDTTPSEPDFIYILSPKDRLLRRIDIPFITLESVVKEHFKVISAELTNYGPEVVINRPTDLSLYDAFADKLLEISSNLRVTYRKLKSSDESVNPVILRFFYWEEIDLSKRFNLKNIQWQLIFFLVSFACIMITGWLYYREIYRLLEISHNILIDMSIFSLSLLAIYLCHEIAHLLMERKKKIKLSLPYFIPLVPTSGFLSYFMLGSAGGIIRVVNPVRKRDDLFDLYFIGPIIGLVISVGFFIGGSTLPLIVDKSTLSTETLDLIASREKFDPFLLLGWFLNWFTSAAKIAPPFDSVSQVQFLHPLSYAGLIGIIVNGLNYLPAYLLDGGTIFRSLFNERLTRIVSFISALLILLNYNTWTLGIVAMFIPFNQYQTSITNEVVKAHWSKYLLWALAVLLGLCCLPIQTFLYW
ncbi:MAG: site-2 protease family protein [Asgard group archaeon]|nr:site-2 protease family protein [Asgard group archaeon]